MKYSSNDLDPSPHTQPDPDPKEFDVDYGVPIDETCSETSPDVFEREWTKAKVTFDCNKYAANIHMKT